MAVKLYASYGRAIAQTWGIDSGDSVDVKIASMTESQKSMCLMAATAEELRLSRTALIDVLVAVQQLASRPPVQPVIQATPPPLPVPTAEVLADGMRDWMQSWHRDKRISDLDCRGLTIRAVKSLRRAGIALLSEITSERLENVKGCGKTTRRQLLDWADRRRRPRDEEAED
jgi:hypothetical protein